jgi:pilus assembly protein Flp/PilA
VPWNPLSTIIIILGAEDVQQACRPSTVDSWRRGCNIRRARKLARATERIHPSGEPPIVGHRNIKEDHQMVNFLLRRDEDGQGLAEYALILALIAIIAIAALIFLGGEIASILSTIGASI